MDNVNVGYYIRLRRTELGMTQVQLAQKIGKSSQVISNWERGYSPSMKMGELASIARALQVNVNYFFPAPNNQMDNHPPRSGQTPAICNKKLSTAYGTFKEHY